VGKDATDEMNATTCVGDPGRTLRAVQISSLGTYVPPRVLTNSQLEQIVDTSDEWIVKRTGIRERHIADDDVATSDLAVEAARIALINRVLPRDELMPWAITMAETIAANSPMAVQAVKEQVSATDDAQNRPREDLEQVLGDRVRASPDFAEGIAAFQQKRPANF